MISFSKAALLSVLTLNAALPAENNQAPKLLGKLPIPFPAFASISESSLYVSTFNSKVNDQDFVYRVRDASKLFTTTTSAQPVLERMNASVMWPNYPSKVAPVSLFGVKGIVIPGGFLAPGKQSGGLWFGTDDGTIIELFRSPNYFYHTVSFYDVNQDGKLDILTCRANKGMFTPAKGDLVWLEPNDRNQPLGKWNEKIIGKGCDTFFILEDINSDGKIDILAPEFWGKKLTLIESKNGRFDNADELVFTTIDDSQGNLFTVQFVDINGDGKKDILATNHVDKGGKVFAYEIPTKSTDKWIRHDLATTFPHPFGFFVGAPGAAEAFYPTDKHVGKPHIIVAGDATQKAYILLPDEYIPWRYTQTILHDSFAIGDSNGKKELYVPCYENGYVAKYTY